MRQSFVAIMLLLAGCSMSSTDAVVGEASSCVEQRPTETAEQFLQRCGVAYSPPSEVVEANDALLSEMRRIFPGAITDEWAEDAALTAVSMNCDEITAGSVSNLRLFLTDVDPSVSIEQADEIATIVIATGWCETVVG